MWWRGNLFYFPFKQVKSLDPSDTSSNLWGLISPRTKRSHTHYWKLFWSSSLDKSASFPLPFAAAFWEITAWVTVSCTQYCVWHQQGWAEWEAGIAARGKRRRSTLEKVPWCSRVPQPERLWSMPKTQKHSVGRPSSDLSFKIFFSGQGHFSTGRFNYQIHKFTIWKQFILSVQKLVR